MEEKESKRQNLFCIYIDIAINLIQLLTYCTLHNDTVFTAHQIKMEAPTICFIV